MKLMCFALGYMLFVCIFRLTVALVFYLDAHTESERLWLERQREKSEKGFE